MLDYQADDSEHRLHTNAYLDLLEQDFKDTQIDGQSSPDQCRKFLRAFGEVALNCVARGNLTKKQASTRFMLALPRNLRTKAVQAASKNRESLNANKMNAFDNIYSAVEAQLNSERDLYAIANPRRRAYAPLNESERALTPARIKSQASGSIRGTRFPTGRVELSGQSQKFKSDFYDTPRTER
ncbi:hypothetical protein DL98DRAFT_625207 [Cadophora sp. DSE1049]|nr:hypothetical protein DL98DRAFT_625207 [Cadophora sp. DSE1049]